MKTSAIIIITILFFFQMSAQGIFYVGSNARVSVESGARIAFEVDIENHGTYRSYGTEIFSKPGDQTIFGPIAGINFFGNLEKGNNGNIILTGDLDCSTLLFQTDGIVWVPFNSTVFVKNNSCDAIAGYSPWRFFNIGNQSGFLKRSIMDTATDHWYVFPIGNDILGYQRLDYNFKSLGQSNSAPISMMLSNSQGVISCDTVYNGGCNPHVQLNCLGGTMWKCYGPIDYEYSIRAFGNPCGAGLARVVRTETGANGWNADINNVVGNIAQNFCDYSDWSFVSDTIPGGIYRGVTSDFAIAVGLAGGTLPVELVFIKAEPINNRFIRISWQTGLEINNDRFLIQRSIDGYTFETIGETAGHGNSTVHHDYFVDDHTAQPNIQYYYRLKQINYDGEYEFSEIVSAKLTTNEIVETKLFNILGQEIPEGEQGIILIRNTTPSRTWITKEIR